MARRRKVSPKIKYVRKEMGKMFRKTKGKRARAKAMKAIWRKAKRKYG